MTYLTLAALGAALALFGTLGLRASRAGIRLDDYVTARNSQGTQSIGLSFLASSMGAWILFAPPEIAAFVGPVGLAGYAIGAALPFVVLGLYGPAIRRRLPEGRSISEFAEACYGPGVRRWVAFVSVAYMACFLAAELTAIGSIAGLLSDVDPSLIIIGIALVTLVYTTLGGLRASMATDRWQAWLLLALLLLVAAVAWWGLPPLPPEATMPAAPMGSALSVGLTLVIAVTAANLFHQGYWQRVWAAENNRALGRGALFGAVATLVVVMIVGGLGMLAAMQALSLGEPPIPFFALVSAAPGWLSLPALVLAVTLVASSVDTLQNAIASMAVASTGRKGLSMRGAQWITVLLMVPVVWVGLQGFSVLRLFLIADLLCAAIVVPVLLGPWQRMSALAALAGGVAGLVGAILPGWVTTGSLTGGVLAASFPDSVPTLGPFLGALLASTGVSMLIAVLRPARASAPH
ncbi:sodium:solute symporter [Salicola sp. Rm-C-2C1-2]|uniref:sodium:solute symporter family transporter n=1 Tax=Salicola sp. Rm-C-2C1-2 TaxID=3141321 RepID=UPI0032E47BFD